MGKRKQIAIILAVVLMLTTVPWHNPVPVKASGYQSERVANWDLSSGSGLGQCQNVSFVKTEGVDKNVAKFNGTKNNTSYITLPNTSFSSISASTGLTVSLWFNADESTGEWSRLFDFGNSAFANNPPFIFLTPGMQFSYNSNNSAWMQGEGAELNCDVYEAVDVNYGSWNHAVVSLSATEISLYLNGNRVGGAENDNRRILNTLKQYNCFDLGRSKYSADPDYVGYMRDVSIYKTALTAEDVADLYKEEGGTGPIQTPSPYQPHEMDASKNSDSSIKFPPAPTPYSEDNNRRQWVHDPSLIKADNGYYYMYSTGLIGTEAKKDVEIRRSRDMVNWEYVGLSGLIPANSEVASYIQGNLWAPEVYRYGNEYRMYYSCSGVSGGTSCIALATSAKPEGPFTHKGIVVKSTNAGWAAGGVNAIDANIICDTNGEMYMVWGSFFGGIKIAEMDAATGYLKSGDKNSDSTPGTIIAKRPVANDNGACEGPFIFYNEETEYYYLVVSCGNLTNEDRGAGSYSMRIGRSKSVTGPYKDYNGKDMTDLASNTFEVGYKLATNHKFNKSNGWMCIGGNSVYKEDGKYWCVAHAREGDGSKADGSVYVNIRQLFWTEEGWPISNPSLYAGEQEQKVPVEFVPGKYERIEFSYTKEGRAVTSKTLQMYPDYTASVGSTSGTWHYSGKNTVTIVLGNVEEKYKIVPSWDWENNRATYTIMGINIQNGLQRWGKKTAYYDWTGEEPIEKPTQNPSAPTPTAMVTSAPTVQPYKESMIYGYDFETAPVEANQIAPVTQSAKSGQASLVGTAVIEKDTERGNVLHIQNAQGAKMVNYLRLPNDTLSTVTGDGYTVSMWVNAGTDVAAPSALFEANRDGKSVSSSGNNAYPMTRVSADLKSHINANGYVDCLPGPETLLTRNQWHHVVYSVNSSGICTYLDGKMIQTAKENLSGPFDRTNDFSIHKAAHVTVGAGVIWDNEDVRDARFDNIAIYNKTLSEEEVETLHNNDASNPFLNDSLIYGFDFESGTLGGKITPMTGSAKIGRAELRGSAVIKTDPDRGNILSIKNPEGAKSNSYLRLPADVLTTVTNNGYTVSMWANIGAGTFGHSALFEANRSGAKNAWPMTRISANLIARINATQDAFSDTKGIGEDATKPFSVNEWHYITYSVDTKGIRLYLDGKLVEATSANLTNCFNASLTDSIQKAEYTTIGSGRIWDDEDVREAMFDNVMIFNMALSDAQVEKMYQDETGGEDPDDPTTPTQKPDDPSTPTQKPDDPSIPTQKPDDPSIPTQKPDDPSTPTQKPDDPSVPTQKPDHSAAPPEDTDTIPSGEKKGTVSLAEAGKILTNTNTDKGDPKGSVFAGLRLNAKGGKNSVKLSWSKVKGAEGYIIYGSACGKKLKETGKVSSSKKSVTIKKLKRGKYYKYIVAAYKKIGGEMRVFAQSKSVHACTTGGKAANPVKILAKKNLTLKKGKTKKISAKLKPVKKVKVHIAKFRYESTNTKVASVNKKGKITAKKKGTCSIYVYTQNGLYVKIKVKVKK